MKYIEWIIRYSDHIDFLLFLFLIDKGMLVEWKTKFINSRSAICEKKTKLL